MAVATEVTVSTGSAVRVDGRAREVGVSLTYRLEPEDEDIMQVVREKAAEVERMRQIAWKSIRDEQVASRSGAPEETAPPQDAQVLADEQEEVEAEPSTATQIKAINALVRASPLSEDEFEALLQKRFGCSHAIETSRPQAGSLLVELQRNERERLARLRGENGRSTPARNS